MKAFKFRLHAILNLKHLAKNEALQAYGIAQKKRILLEDQARGCEHAIDNLQSKIDRERQSLSKAHHNAYYLKMLEYEQVKLKCLNEKLNEAKKEEASVLKVYLTLKQEEEMIEKIKLKLKKKHDNAALLADQKDLEAILNKCSYKN